MLKPSRLFRLSSIAILLAAAGLSARTGQTAAQSVPAPSITRLTGPGIPLIAALEPLDARGYVETEFTVRGQARRYRIPNPLADAQPVDGDHPYVTRALVRRPVAASRFNGTAVVEWLNVSTGQDADFVYAATRELLTREGYAWIGVSVQRAGVERLVTWNSGRYGTLTVAASNIDPRDGTTLDPVNPGTASVGGDVLAWDVFSQVGSALLAPASGLMGGLPVRRVIAAGESQSAFRLSTYFNSIQPLHAIFSGFLFYDRSAPLRTDVQARVLNVGTEFMNQYLNGSPQADSPTQRSWEIAGASHVSVAEMDGYVNPMVRRDGVFKAPDGRAMTITDQVAAGHCGVTPLWSRVPNGDVMKAALHALNAWVTDGMAPPGFPHLVTDVAGRLVRDAEGRVSRGIRTAAYDIPRAANAGTGTGDGMCVGAGSHVDFSDLEMCRRYGSHDAYVARVTALTDASVQAGALLPEEAKRTVAEAKTVTFDCSR